MQDQPHSGIESSDAVAMRKAVEISIRLLIIAIFVAWSFRIIEPFINLVVMSGVIAAAIFPLYSKLARAIGGRPKSASAIIVVLALGIIMTPVIMMAGNTLETVQTIHQQMEEGTLKVSPPPAKVEGWPVIGPQIHGVWSEASDSLQAFGDKYEVQIETIVAKAVSWAAGAGAGLIKLAIAIILAGVFMVLAPSMGKGFALLGDRLAPGKGEQFTTLSTNTVRSVAVGVLGVAFIQATLGGLGMLWAGVPGAGIWAGLILILAIMQLPPLIILLPAAFWVFANVDSTAVQWVFLVYAILVSLSDGILKPMLLGRGVDVPMLVVLLGAIGGMLLSGIIGLFVGAVILAIAWQMFEAWLTHGKSAEKDLAAAGAPDGDGH